MKTLVKAVIVIAVVAAILGAAGAAYLFLGYPQAGSAPDLQVRLTPERIERGRYLAENLLGCIDCHSIRDWRYYAGPVVPGTEGKGGDEFGPSLGLPGTFYGTNITPAGIGDWSDGELFLAIVSGINKKGEALFPIMPYPAYNRMPEEDVYSVIAYLRTLKSIESSIPPRRIDFPVNFLIRTFPIPYVSGKKPIDSGEVSYGEYVTALASCAACHTPTNKGQPVKGMDLAGGAEFVLPGGQLVRASNITPDPETGIGNWSLDSFLDRFRLAAALAAEHAQLPKNSVNTMMPWIPQAGISEKDLSAIYAYLRTVKAVKNQIEIYPSVISTGRRP